MTTTVNFLPVSGDRLSDVVIPIVITSDENGGALAAKVISVPSAYNMKLDEVEIVHGDSTAKLTLKNNRGTTVFEVPSLSATENKIYGGHSKWGIFPKKDGVWTIETDGFSNNDEVKVFLKFSRLNA